MFLNNVCAPANIVNMLRNYSTGCETITSSSERSFIVTRPDCDTARIFYTSSIQWKKIVDTCALLDVPELIKILDVCEHELSILTECVDPVIKYVEYCPVIDPKYTDIAVHARQLLHTLHSRNISHGDASLDNIGFNIKKQKYQFMDLETIVLDASDKLKKKDVNYLETSIKFHT